jgi:hypothetical protein
MSRGPRVASFRCGCLARRINYRASGCGEKVWGKTLRPNRQLLTVIQRYHIPPFVVVERDHVSAIAVELGKDGKALQKHTSAGW